MSLRGIDVSDYNQPIDWLSVANDGILFAFVKATEGMTLVSETFADNWRSAKKAGLIRGAYHFFLPDRSAQTQADLFLQTVALEPGDLPPVLDIETTKGVDILLIRDRMIEWLDIIEKETGSLAIIYTYPGFWQQLQTTGFINHPLWIAHYTTNEQPIIPGGWREWTFWQYTDRGKVNGIPGNVDVNLFDSITFGSMGEKVRLIQERLKKLGFYQGLINSYFGQPTQTAAIAFQKSQNLVPDGIVGIRTWAHLMGKSWPIITVKPMPTPVPTPVPTPAPTPVTKPLAITLVNVYQNYRGEPVQKQALEWLQTKIGKATLADFASRWYKNYPHPPTNIKLVDIAGNYQNLSQQKMALDWLQNQIISETLTEFAQRWQTRTVTGELPISLLNVCQYYRATNPQRQALDWLQTQISGNVINEFTKKWRSNLTFTGGELRLTAVCKYYQGLEHQKTAILWLEKQINLTTLTEFAKKWRSV